MPRARRTTDPHPELGLPEVRKLWQTEGLFSDHYLKKRIEENFMVAKRQETLFKGHCIVVTQEKPSRGNRPKIPDVCQHYDIECISVAGLFRKEGWKF
jgi:hypothetical protein